MNNLFFVLYFNSLKPLMQFLEDNEESRNNIKQSNSAHRHATYNTKSKYTIAIGTCTAGNNQWYQCHSPTPRVRSYDSATPHGVS